jgi:hypothetical protein
LAESSDSTTKNMTFDEEEPPGEYFFAMADAELRVAEVFA